MKYVLPAFYLLALLSCKKEISVTTKASSNSQLVAASLRDSMGQAVESLDFSRALRSSVNADTAFLRIPFKGIALSEQFVLLQTDKEAHILRGRIVSISRQQTPGDTTPWRFEGSITVKTLRGMVWLQSSITNGYISTRHPNLSSARTAIVPGPVYEDLPEVIVVGTHTSGGISYSTWAALQSLLDNGNEVPNRSFYNELDGGGGVISGNGGTGGGGSFGIPDHDPAIEVDFEEQADNPAINIEDYLRCFDLISDVGATCSIEIFADIPVDSDPNKFFNFESGSPGHTFIQLKKSNGNQSVMQNIGFYPKNGWKNIFTNAPMEGKFVDNSHHDFNASLKMSLSTLQLKEVITYIIYLSRFIRYDIDNYNCTDFALDVFNNSRIKKLEIPLYDVPGNYPSTGTRTPQGIYSKLKSMQQAGDPESGNITIPGVFGWVASSHGPCN